MREEMGTLDTLTARGIYNLLCTHVLGIPKKTPPFHPAYGLHDTTRATILKDAADTSVPEAARKHNVAQSTIYRWRAVLAGG